MSSYPPSVFPSSSAVPHRPRQPAYSPLASLPIPLPSRPTQTTPSPPLPSAQPQLHPNLEPSSSSPPAPAPPPSPPPPPPPPPTRSRVRLPIRTALSGNATSLQARSSALTLISACSSSTTLNSHQNTTLPLLSSTTLLLTHCKPSQSLISSVPSSSASSTDSSSPAGSADRNSNDHHPVMCAHAANGNHHHDCAVTCCHRFPRETPAELLLPAHVQHNEQQAKIIMFHVSHRRVLRARSFSLALRATRRLISTLHALRAAARALEKRAAFTAACACDLNGKKTAAEQVQHGIGEQPSTDACGCHCCSLSSSSSVSMTACTCKSRVHREDGEAVAHNSSTAVKFGLPSSSSGLPGLESRAGDNDPVNIGVGARCSSSRTGRTASYSSSSSSTSDRAKARTRVIYEAPRRVDGLHASLRAQPVTRRSAQSCPNSSTGNSLPSSKSKHRIWKSSSKSGTASADINTAANATPSAQDKDSPVKSSPPGGVKPTSKGRVVGPSAFVRVRGRGRQTRQLDPATAPRSTPANNAECSNHASELKDAMLGERLTALEQSLRASRERALRASADVSAAQDVFVLLSIFLGLSTNLAPYPDVQRTSCLPENALDGELDGKTSPGITATGHRRMSPGLRHSPLSNIVRARSQTQSQGGGERQRPSPGGFAGGIDSKSRRRRQRRQRMVRPVSAPVLGSTSSADSFPRDAQLHSPLK